MQVIESGLVPVYEGDNRARLVNARELHEFLGSGRKFSDWIQDRVDMYDLQPGVDFFTATGKSTGGRPPVEYYLTMDTAKEIAMVENNDRGRQIRRYFIEVEKRSKEMQLQPAIGGHLSLDMIGAIGQSLMTLAVEAKETRVQVASLRDDVQAMQEARREAEESLAALPAPESEAKPLERRAQINRILRDYTIQTGSGYQFVYNRLYLEFRDRYHIDLKARRKGRETALDVAERISQMESLYALAHHLFGQRAG